MTFLQPSYSAKLIISRSPKIYYKAVTLYPSFLDSLSMYPFFFKKKNSDRKNLINYIQFYTLDNNQQVMENKVQDSTIKFHIIKKNMWDGKMLTCIIKKGGEWRVVHWLTISILLFPLMKPHKWWSSLHVCNLITCNVWDFAKSRASIG